MGAARAPRDDRREVAGVRGAAAVGDGGVGGFLLFSRWRKGRPLSGIERKTVFLEEKHPLIDGT